MTDKVSFPPIRPMLAKTGQMPVDIAAYGYEIKWDGIRAVAFLTAGRLRLLSRNLKDITSQYPEIADLAKSRPEQALILDGEIITLGSDGKPSFTQLQHRMGRRSPLAIQRLMQETPAIYIIFDLLYCNGQLLLNRSYTERRRVLDDLGLSGPAWQTPAYRRGDGPALQETCRASGLEGIVAKRLDSRYESGLRTGAWVKIKNQRRQELIIGGWVPGQGNRTGTIGALLVGYYEQSAAEAAARHEPPRLMYAGKVGSGFSAATLADLHRRLAALESPTMPFYVRPPVIGARYVRPELVGEFEFTEWTPHNTLRHPAFKGLRQDKAGREVIREPG